MGVARHVNGERVVHWPKACACGAIWWPARFRALVYVGEWAFEGESLELRNCVCGSTIAIPAGVSVPRWAQACGDAERLCADARELIAEAKRVCARR